MKKKLILALFGFLLLSPILSFTLRTILLAQTSDSPTVQTDSQAVRPGTSVESPVKAEVSRPPRLVYVMTIDGVIGTVVNDWIADAVQKAEDNNAEMLVIRMDTPGGFTQPTWDIIKSVLNSTVPVCVYIWPSGSRAGSAGVYIAYAANFVAMAPSTNIGAAHPVMGSGEQIDSVMNEKITNDAVAQIKAAADKRGRNAEWAEKAVRESVSITDKEALEMNVINVRADNLDDLFEKLNGKTTEVPGGEKTMDLGNVRTEDIKMSFSQKLLQVITSPDIAFILFSIGSLGILVELWSPGAILPGVVGAICIVLAFYSFSVLPVNYAGVALILVAIVLFILEIKIASAGLLTIGGLVSLFLGGLMLINTNNPALEVSKSVLITVTLLVGGTLAVVILLVVKAARRKPFIGHEGFIGKRAVVRTDHLVFFEGALWKADFDEDLEPGTKVVITGVQDLTLKVKKVES